MSSQPTLVLLDLNNPVFQRHLFGLSKEQQRSVLLTLKKISELSWDQIYRDAGLKWEAIHLRTGSQGQRIYSLRIGKGFRAVAYREGDWMHLLSLHPDHDSAYE